MSNFISQIVNNYWVFIQKARAVADEKFTFSTPAKKYWQRRLRKAEFQPLGQEWGWGFLPVPAKNKKKL